MDLPTTLFELLQSASEPQTAAQLSKALPDKVAAQVVAAALLQLSESGRVRAFAFGKSTAYSARAPLDLCAEALALKLPLITQAVPPAKLKSALPKTLQPWFDEALGRLVVHGLAYWLPKGKTRLVQSRPVKPSDLIAPATLNQLKKLLTEANRHRRQPRQLSDLLAWLDAEERTAPAEPGPAPEPTPQQLRQWHEADRAKSSTSMIPIHHTWKHYETWASGQGLRADVLDFRQAVEALYNADDAMLEPHERPQDLPEHERLLQVPLSLGPPGYYWSPMV